MVKIRKYANGIERFLHGQKGQRFFNFAYSIGAAIVIWGALFKILHLPGGSTLLCIGMGTEIAMFILTAFDRPPKEYAWEEVFPALDTHNPEDRPDFSGGVGTTVINGGAPAIAGGCQASADVHAAAGLPSGVALSEEDTESLRTSIQKMSAASEQLAQMAELTDATQQYLSQMAGIADQMTRLQETTRQLNEVSGVLLNSYRAITENSERINGSATGYVDHMEDLNRNISESSRYCEETEKMARYMKQLNQVYEKMITAMTINMYNPMMGGNPAAAGGDNPFAREAGREEA